MSQQATTVSQALEAVSDEPADRPCAQVADEPLSEAAFDILRAALRIARDEQIRRLTTLRSRLESAFPGQQADVRAALLYWAGYHKSKGI